MPGYTDPIFWPSPYWLPPLGGGGGGGVDALYQTAGVNQQAAAGYGADYPFVRAPAAVRYLLTDLLLAYDDPADAAGYALPLKIKTLAGFDLGEGADKDLVVTDAGGRVVLDTAAASSRTARSWGRSLVTLAWRAGTAVLRCTMRTAPPPWDFSRTWAAVIDLSGDADAALDGRALLRLPRRLTSVRVGDVVLDAGDVDFAAGYNVTLDAAPAAANDGGRRTASVTFGAAPGSGPGRYGGCADEAAPLRRLGGAAPTAGGDLFLDAGGCYRVQRPVELSGGVGGTAAVTPHALQLYNDCTPCCKCDDFARTYAGVARLFDRWRALGAAASAARDGYAANVDRYNAQAACRAAHPLKLVLAGERDGVLFVGGLACNATACCLVPAVLRTTFEYFRDGSPLDVAGAVGHACRESRRAGTDTDGVEVPYDPLVNWPVADHYFDLADPSAVSRFRTRWRLPAQDGDAVRVTLSLHAPGTAFDPATGKACPVPTQDSLGLPAEVLAAWAASPPPYPARAFVQRVTAVGPTAGCCAG